MSPVQGGWITSDVIYKVRSQFCATCTILFPGELVDRSSHEINNFHLRGLGAGDSHTPILANNCLKLNFKLFFVTDVINYCEERKIKLSVNVYIKIARNLGSNFWQFFSNFLAF